MSIVIKKQLLDQSKYALKCPYTMKAEFICIHNTYNDASAQNEVKYHNSNNTTTSFHFAIDDKEVIQCLPLERNGFHAGDGSVGDGNRKSIGIEICYSKSGGERYEKAEELAIKFTAQLLHERNWGIDRVKSHKYFSEVGVKKGYSRFVKNCPHSILDRKDGWENFLKSVQLELNKLKGKGELTLSEYKELKALIESQAKEIKSLNAELGKKLDSPSTSSTPSTWAKDAWVWAKKTKDKKGVALVDGSNAQGFITREQMVTILNRYDNK